MRTSVIREFKECLRNNTKYRIIVLTIADVNVVAFICFVCVTLNHKIFYRRHRTVFLWFRARPLLCSCFPFLSPSVTIICFLFSSFLSPFLLLLSLLFLFHKVGLTRGLKESSFQSRGTCLLVFVLAEWIMKPYFVSPITSSPERSQCSAWLSYHVPWPLRHDWLANGRQTWGCWPAVRLSVLRCGRSSAVLEMWSPGRGVSSSSIIPGSVEQSFMVVSPFVLLPLVQTVSAIMAFLVSCSFAEDADTVGALLWARQEYFF